MGESARFRLNQKLILEAILRGTSPILGVLPTGGGKSLLYLLPATYGFSGTTIVITPLVALEHSLALEARRLHITSYIWDSTR